MDYNTVIKKIYRLLLTYERYNFPIYKNYLISLIEYLDGIDNPPTVLVESLFRLKGLCKWTENETVHKYVRDCVLDSCNQIQRFLKVDDKNA